MNHRACTCSIPATFTHHQIHVPPSPFSISTLMCSASNLMSNHHLPVTVALYPNAATIAPPWKLATPPRKRQKHDGHQPVHTTHLYYVKADQIRCQHHHSSDADLKNHQPPLQIKPDADRNAPPYSRSQIREEELAREGGAAAPSRTAKGGRRV